MRLDLEVRDSGDTMIGLLGFEVTDQFRTFAEDDFSWLKGSTYGFTGAQRDTVVPFAVDLRDRRRWVAVATSGRIQHSNFATGLEAVLNAAVQHLGLMTTDWEVDTVTSRSSVLDWVADHDTIKKFRRVVKFPNPGRNLDEDRQLMRQLGATVHEEQYRARQGHSLRLRDNPAFADLLDGLEHGDIEVDLEAVAGLGVKERFNSRERPDEVYIDGFTDLQAGMEGALRALKVYSSQQATKQGIV